MVDLDILNNATLLYNLKARYYAEPRQIYTYVTPSLLVVNPYQSVPHLMTEEIVKTCLEFVERPKAKLKDVVPHTYSITARALKQMYGNLSLIHICRCRRYAVCRSRWSPYH
eukprot:TRINITY_DN16420_c0_g1_i1.p1 TRINITY_DN16420_c0_g1~~TRINITY_DN16420_c0_g1_i1.p1  ORF type:complete len:112 (+),score=29.97 TRINITY_DN16420_c0_g1_i1:515-850(+)